MIAYHAIVLIAAAFILGLHIGQAEKVIVIRRLKNIHEVAKGIEEGAHRDNSTALDFIVGESDLAIPQRDFNTKEVRSNFRPPKIKNNGNNVWL